MTATPQRSLRTLSPIGGEVREWCARGCAVSDLTRRSGGAEERRRAARTLRPFASRSAAKGQVGGVGVWVLVGIVALSAGLWVMGSVFFGTTGDHRPGIARTQFETLKGRLDAFKLEYGRYPTQAEGLQALVTPAAKPNGRVPSPFVDEGMLRDPWGGDIEYLQPSPDGLHSFDLVSLGEDGEPGGDSYADADVSLWQGGRP